MTAGCLGPIIKDPAEDIAAATNPHEAFSR
jgi:hypothetical protein